MAGDSIEAASPLMTSHGADAVVVLGAAGAPEGILTDRDLRERVLAAGRGPGEPVDRVMSAPLVTVSTEASLLDAVLDMTRLGLHHLAVMEAGQLLGVVSGHDLLHLHAAAPVQLAQMIRSARTLKELAPVLPALVETIRRLFEQGLSGSDIGRIVAEINDHLVRQVLGQAEEALRDSDAAAPPVAYCWLALGSEGRREQTISWWDLSLEGLGRLLEVEMVDRHTARGDALTAGLIFLRMIPRLEERGVRTLSGALRLQRSSAAIHGGPGPAGGGLSAP